MRSWKRWSWQTGEDVSLEYLADLATERERQLLTACANQTTGLTNGTAANWAPEVGV